VSGDVVRPGYFEIEVGAVTMGQLVFEMAGGPRYGRTIKAIIPGGSSAKVLRADEVFKIKDAEMTLWDLPMDFDSVAAAGSMAGSGGVIVMDDSRDMVWALNNLNEFYAHESCGQCTPCREGSLWMKKITDRMMLGGGVVEDPKTLVTWPITSPAARSAHSAKRAHGRPRVSSRSSRRSSTTKPRSLSRLRFHRNTRPVS
jgi:NADH-quinone oxidoreductase subunit F